LDERLAAFASQTGRVDLFRLHGGLAAHEAEQLLTRDERLAEKYHVDATPTMFINGVRQRGFGTAQELVSAVDLAALELAPRSRRLESLNHWTPSDARGTTLLVEGSSCFVGRRGRS